MPTMEVWNNRLLVQGGSWDDVNSAATSVRSVLMDRLVRQQALPAGDGLAYWVAVPRSVASTSLFYVQTAPGAIARLIWEGRAREKIKFQHWKTAIRRELSRCSSIHTATELLTYIVARARALGRVYCQLAREVVKDKTERLETQRRQAAEEIGRLLLTDPKEFGPNREFVNALISGLESSERLTDTDRVAIKADFDSPAAAMDSLQRMLDESGARKRTPAIPSFWVRWWPALMVAGFAAYKLNGSWTEVMSWLHNSVWTTLSSFWQNWVVDPLVQVYLTIRHDPTQQMGLIAKESLPSDRQSLERMVVDFARDMNANLSPAELRQIGQLAADGNVEPVMAVYEQQITAPIINLVFGKLVRTMLIQVQKTKVDLEVALSGIDQLLQSQQLVFGLVAAVPAFGVVWWVTNSIMTYFYERIYGSRASKSEKDAVFGNLQTLDLVIQSVKYPQLTVEEVGLIYCSVVSIRDVIPNSDSTARQQLWQSLDRIVEHTIARDTHAVLNDLDRLYSRYMAVKMQF